MKMLTVSFVFCSIMTLSRAGPVTNSSMKTTGICEYIVHHSSHLVGEFVPQCDDHGNFRPQQCWGSTGYCWCVNVITGQEIPNTRTPLGTTPVNCDGESYCPTGWSHYGGQCFIFIDNPTTWVEAETYCLFEGANLASVHSYDHSHFIQGLTRGDGHNFPHTWIGGHNTINSYVWLWSDGSKFYYENWSHDDDHERKNSCLMMNYGYEYKWSSCPCNETLPFVCAKMM